MSNQGPENQVREKMRQCAHELCFRETTLTLQKVKDQFLKLGIEDGGKFVQSIPENDDKGLREWLASLHFALTDPNQFRIFDLGTDATYESAFSPESPKSHNPFPEGTVIESLPNRVRDSWTVVKKKLLPEKQSKISYYEKAGEWFINLNGTKISLQNESAKSDPKKGINVVGDNTYFSQEAAIKHAQARNRELPTNALWSKMAAFLGEGNEGFKNLKDILQIKLNGWFHLDHGLRNSGDYADVWSADGYECLYVNTGGGDVCCIYGSAGGRGVRLLDT